MSEKNKFYIRISDLNVEVNAFFEYPKEICKEYIVNDTHGVDLIVSVEDHQIEKEKSDTGEGFTGGYYETIMPCANTIKNRNTARIM